MASSMDLLGSLLQSGLKPSTTGRLEHSLGDQGLGQSGGLLGELLSGLAGASGTGAAPSGAGQAASGLGGLKELASAFLGDSKNLKTAGLGALAGAVLGGGGKSMKGAMGGGALALLGTLALQAMRNAGGQQAASADAPKLDENVRLAAGLRAPKTPQEEKEVETVANLLVRSMINAAKADGRIDKEELQKIVGKVGADGVSQAEQEFLMSEFRKPMDTDGIVRSVPSQQVAAQVYAASLLAVELDTQAEKQYLEELSQKLRLPSNVIAYLHRTVGLA